MTDKYLEVFESLTEEQACERTFVDAHPAALCLTTDSRRVIFGGKRYNSARAIRMCDIDALAEGKNLATIKRNCDTFRVEDEDGNFCSTLIQFMSGNKAIQVLVAYQEEGAVYEIRTCPVDADMMGTQFGPWSLVNREMRDITIDSHLSETSANTVQNAAVTNEIKRFENVMTSRADEYEERLNEKVDTLGQKVDELEKRPIGGGGGAFPEAPTDGEAYGRVNGEWGKVLKKPSVEVTEIPVTLTLDDDIGGYSGDKFIDTGEVIVNGERYSCQQGNFMGLTCYGNLSLIGGTGGENVPFFYVDYSVMGVPMAVISTIDIHSFSFVGEALTNLIPISNIETENAWEELVENKWKATSNFSANYRNSWRVNGPKAGDTLHVKYKINPDFPSADPDYSTVGEFIKDRFPVYEQFLEFEDDLEVIYGGNYNPPTEYYIFQPMAFFAEGMCLFVTSVVSVLIEEMVLSSYDDINNPDFIDIKFGYCKNTDTTPMPSTISGKDKKRDVFYVIEDNEDRFYIEITPTNIKRDTVYIVKFPLSKLNVQISNYDFENKWKVNPNEVTIIFETGSDVSNFLELRHPGIDVRIVGELTIEPNTSYMMSIFCNTIVLSELNEAQ